MSVYASTLDIVVPGQGRNYNDVQVDVALGVWDVRLGVWETDEWWPVAYLTPDQAREVAAALVKAADRVDRGRVGDE